MLTYQVKVTVDALVEEKWLHWMKTVHIPDVIATGLIRSFHILKPEIGEERTYYFHYHFSSKADFDHYTQEFGPALKADVLEKFPDQFTASRQVFAWI